MRNLLCAFVAVTLIPNFVAAAPVKSLDHAAPFFHGYIGTFVLYDEDGDWQLFGDDEVVEDEDAYLVTVEEIMEMEPALRKLPDMQPGQCKHMTGTSYRITFTNRVT